MRFIYYIVVLAIFVWSQLYWGMPTFRWGFNGLPMMLLFLAGVVFVLERNWHSKRSGNVSKALKIPSILLVLSAFFALIIPFVTSWSAFRADDYRNLVGEVKIGESFADDVAPISIDKIRIVDQELAYRLGDKVLGSEPSLGSQAHLGTFRIQKVNGEFVWVAPLIHSGIFKWWNNKEGANGYVVVSATNERDVRLVQKIGETPIKIKYQPGGFAGDFLPRHIYFNGYMTQGFTDYTFEIDDKGMPFWVVSLYDKKVGFGGSDVIGVLTVDAMSGDIKEYSIEEAPIWLDRIQPKKFVQRQLDDWGEFVHGWWNPSNEEKLTTTNGMSLVYDQNDRSYWYTGLTSVGSDQGTVGFLLVDTRTKETTWYKQIGATEQAAMSSAEGKVQEKGYQASFPVTYNINGAPTYVMPLKDRAGLIKMVSMVSVQDYSIVAVGADLNEAVRAYKNELNSSGNEISPTNNSTKFKINSTINRLSTDVKSGNTFYYMTLSGYPHKVFIITSAISDEIPITQAGDSVLVTYDDGKTKTVDIVDFDNLEISAQKTDGAEIKKME
ncbi:MAG: hypothetical protein ACI81T_003379 [Bacteroidia bacterium]|jgi:hypothetical protein